MIYEVVSYNVTIDNTTNATVPVGSPPVSVYYGPVPSPLPAGVTYKTLINQTQPAHNMTATCLSLIASSMTWRSTMLRRLQVNEGLFYCLTLKDFFLDMDDQMVVH